MLDANHYLTPKQKYNNVRALNGVIYQLANYSSGLYSSAIKIAGCLPTGNYPRNSFNQYCILYGIILIRKKAQTKR